MVGLGLGLGLGLMMSMKRKIRRMTIGSIVVGMLTAAVVVEGMWCVSRSEASDEELQRGLDYACAAGADCAPIQPTGLCYLPNTLQAHASYAYNSFYQRSHMAPSSCDFSATATLAKTDPSYGSCVFPASPSTAGGITSSTSNTPLTNPNVMGGGATSFTPTTVYGGVGGGGFNPTNMGPPISTTTDSKASVRLSACLLLQLLSHISLLLLSLASL